MIKESAASNSSFVLIAITPANGITLQWRDVSGWSCNKKDFSAVDLPVHLKLTN